MGEGDRPEGMPATEFIMLHDAESENAVAIVFFETEDDYRQGDEVLSAMPASDTPGQRTSVKKYDVAHRMTVVTARALADAVCSATRLRARR